MLEWKAANLRNVTRDVSVFIPQGADAGIIKSAVVCSDGVVSVDIIDVYSKQNKQSVTYRVTIFRDRDAASVQGNVEKLLRGIGCTIR